MRSIILVFVVLVNMSCSDKYNLTAHQKEILNYHYRCYVCKRSISQVNAWQKPILLFGLGNNAFGHDKE